MFRNFGVALRGILSKKDYHLHPIMLKCPAQAEGFVNAAIAKGFDKICFTDHMPFSITHNRFIYIDNMF